MAKTTIVVPETPRAAPGADMSREYGAVREAGRPYFFSRVHLLLARPTAPAGVRGALTAPALTRVGP